MLETNPSPEFVRRSFRSSYVFLNLKLENHVFAKGSNKTELYVCSEGCVYGTLVSLDTLVFITEPLIFV